MQGVDSARFNCAPCCHQGLAGHLAAEDSLALFIRLGAPKNIHLNRFEIKKVDEEVKRVAHLPMLSLSLAQSEPFENRARRVLS